MCYLEIWNLEICYLEICYLEICNLEICYLGICYLEICNLEICYLDSCEDKTDARRNCETNPYRMASWSLTATPLVKNT